MDRRRFLSRSLAGIAAASLAACGDDTTPTPAVAPPAEPPPVTPVPPQPPVLVVYPTPQFLTCDPAFTDYRPAVDASGTRFLFERTPFPNPDKVETILYLLTSNGGGACQAASPFLAVPTTPPATYPYEQTRPDWSWVNDTVAFTGATSSATTATHDVHLVASTGKAPILVPLTGGHIYPIWTSDGKKLVAYNNAPKTALPLPPVSVLIDPSSGVADVPNLNGTNAAGVAVFGGFAAPQPGNPTHIAFAGQPELANWGGATGSAPSYNQDNNYVFVNTYRNEAYSCAPLEPAASIATFDPAYQGRAPYWSPDGQYVVFESSRAGGYALFLANVAEITQGAAPVQLTDETYWAQHAKFLPGGTALVYTCLQQPSAAGTGPRGIALIDISGYLT